LPIGGTCFGSVGADAVPPLRRGSFALALTVLLLVGHGAAAQSGAASTQGTTSSMSTVSPLPPRTGANLTVDGGTNA